MVPLIASQSELSCECSPIVQVVPMVENGTVVNIGVTFYQILWVQNFLRWKEKGKSICISRKKSGYLQLHIDFFW